RDGKCINTSSTVCISISAKSSFVFSPTPFTTSTDFVSTLFTLSLLHLNNMISSHYNKHRTRKNIRNNINYLLQVNYYSKTIKSVSDFLTNTNTVNMKLFCHPLFYSTIIIKE